MDPDHQRLVAAMREIAAGEVVGWDDVRHDASRQAVQVRLEQEALFRRELGL